MSESANLTREAAETTAVAVCQARGCDEEAGFTIPSQHGHPNDEWKLCESHYTDCNGHDPFQLEDIGWTLRKLHYQCTECGESLSHNIDIRKHCC